MLIYIYFYNLLRIYYYYIVKMLLLHSTTRADLIYNIILIRLYGAAADRLERPSSSNQRFFVLLLIVLLVSRFRYSQDFASWRSTPRSSSYGQWYYNIQHTGLIHRVPICPTPFLLWSRVCLNSDFLNNIF